MSWLARLQLDYRAEAARTVARYEHDGPLRILQSLYPEGDAICHNVLVHPPGGLVGGDTLQIRANASTGAHGLVTTPGATRFYRSLGEPAVQDTELTLQAGARMEWLPLETICYNHCIAENRLRLTLAPGAEFMGWDVTALGLPQAGQAFEQGSYCQHIELPGVWLERGRIDATDRRLLNSPLGLAGQRCMGSVFFLSGSPLDRARREQALELARQVIAAHPLASLTGCTSPDGQVIVVRVLAPLVEPVMDLLKSIRAIWRQTLWALPAVNPRIWAM
ncbi:MAG: urease accessory protein UreD [Gammaproteobacteria bacterium]|jgi:urease accessory protein|nr:urease accessory protein UreD [Gammaproteobacteria bacterium]MBU0787771.1 urease accessory protein UreD [Gammaproteobacteria bacterium]MBU0816206.1 urease accessory protein UreD [Gammaproteobacteria bacterium]MBU1786133.1 urease accessory protein UreD [Gammaproteobacteria bacterium]